MPEYVPNGIEFKRNKEPETYYQKCLLTLLIYAAIRTISQILENPENDSLS